MQEIPMKGGEEVDMLSRWRKYLCRKPGEARHAKKKYRRRVRRLEREGYFAS